MQRRTLMTIPLLCFALVSLMLGASATAAEAARVSHPGEYTGYSPVRFDSYVLASQYVPARDGTRLAIDIFRPATKGVVTQEKLPVLWMHTPYNRRNYRDGLTAANYPGKALELVKYGYVVAIADFRGLYASFGKNAGFNRGEWQDAAHMDAYDITEWLAKQSWSTGKVGMWGCSATGGSQMQALSTAPPSLKAVFPMSCEWDVYGFVATGGITPPSGVPTQVSRGGSREERDRVAVAVDGDTDGALLKQAVAGHEGNLETAGFTPFRDSTSPTFGNQWWVLSSPHTYIKTINHARIPAYVAANWDEGATKYGAAFTFNNFAGPRKLIIGPSTHCAWSTVLNDTGFNIVVEELRFYDYWLKGIDNGVMREDSVTYYTYNESPEHSWQTAKAWPLPNEHRTAFYLQNAALSERKPAQSSAATRAVDYTVNEKDFWQKGLTFTTEPLTTDVQVTGHPVLTLWLASSAADADVIARVDDLDASGAAKYYNIEGKLRASLRKTAKPPYNNLGLPWHPFTQDSVEPLTAGVPVKMELDLFPISYLFKAGHRIRLTLNFADERSTPHVDPVPNVTIYSGGDKLSALTLPIIPRAH